MFDGIVAKELGNTVRLVSKVLCDVLFRIGLWDRICNFDIKNLAIQM